MTFSVFTNPVEFLKFHRLITRDTSFNPFYFILEIEGKEPKAGEAGRTTERPSEKPIIS